MVDMLSGIRCVVALAFALQAYALYDAKSDVIQLTASDFNKQVLKGDEVWIVEFYAPWCGHCKSLAPEYSKAASVLKGAVKVAAVDATQHESLAQKYQIQGFPTIKIFGANKKSPKDYQGERKADAIVTEGMKTLNDMIKERKKGGSGKNNKESKPRQQSNQGKSSSDVIELNEMNFNALVADSDDVWFVEFFAPWCGHCKNLAPEWESAATTLKGTVKLGAVDATVNTDLAQKYGVKGYPTIKVIHRGKVTDYQGPREAGGIVAYAENYLESAGIGPAISEITSAAVFNEACDVKNRICVVMFVPHILDTGAGGRNDYLATLADVAKAMKGKPFTYLWSEGQSQLALENALGINAAYPTLAVLSVEKKMYAVQKLSWNKQNSVSFLNGLLSGSERTFVMDEVPKIKKVTPWDGKDAVLEVDEFPLDELDL